MILVLALMLKETVFDLTAYLPDSVVPQYEEFKNTIRVWLEKLGIVRGDVAANAGMFPFAMSFIHD